MSGDKKEHQWSLDRRTFLKAAGLGIAGAAMGRFPFESFTIDEAMAAAAKARAISQFSCDRMVRSMSALYGSLQQ